MFSYGTDQAPKGRNWPAGTVYDENDDLVFEASGDPFASVYIPPSAVVAGMPYELEIEILSIPAGASIRGLYTNPTMSPLVFDAAGVHRFFFVASGAGATLSLRANGDGGEGVVKNDVKLRQIIPD